MQNRYFKATRVGTVGNNTLQEIARWIERFVNVLFPENGIEYWSGFTLSENKKGKTLGQCNIAHIACYVTEGHSEGLIIRLMLVMRDGSHIEMPWAKTFGRWDESWDIAKAASNAMESIVFWGEVPQLVAMADILPRSHGWSRETNLGEPVEIRVGADTLVVATASGRTLASYDFSAESAGIAPYKVRDYAADWETVLRNMGAKFSVVETAEKVAA